MRAHLAGEYRVLVTHAILDEGGAALRNDRFGAVPLADFRRRPNYAWIENDFVVTAVLRQQNVREHCSHVSARNKFTLLIEEHATIGIGIPDRREVEITFAHRLFTLSAISGLHWIGSSFGKSSIRFPI